MQCNMCGGFHHKRIDIKVGEFGTARMPYSEVCMSMGVAGNMMHFQVVDDKYPMAQLIQYYTGVPILKSLLFSFPILLGEAGIYTESNGQMYYYKDLEHEEFIALEEAKVQRDVSVGI